MNESALTAFHRARLAEQTERARAEVAQRTRHAVESMSKAPNADPEARESAPLMSRLGYGAMIFCIWFAFTAPIALILVNWD
jgi:hypothetical protein